MEVVWKLRDAEDRGDECHDSENSRKIAAPVEARLAMWNLSLRSPADAMEAALHKSGGTTDDASSQACKLVSLLLWQKSA